MIDEVHAAGGLMAPQLWHVGAIRSHREDWAPPGPYDSPSGISRPGHRFGEGMSDADIADAIDAFARAAADSQRLGFDAVELHGAHGYLIDQFFWAGTNVRDDLFGGPELPQRARFAAEILKATRAAVGPDFPIMLRVSQWKQQDFNAKLADTPKAMEAWLTPLVEAGADAIHCSQRRFWEPEFEGSDLNFAGWAKKLTGAVSITVGSVGLTGDFIAGYSGEVSKPASLDELLRPARARRLRPGRGRGRALLQDPQWAVKIRQGRSDELMAFDRSAMATLNWPAGPLTRPRGSRIIRLRSPERPAPSI